MLSFQDYPNILWGIRNISHLHGYNQICHISIAWYDADIEIKPWIYGDEKEITIYSLLL